MSRIRSVCCPRCARLPFGDLPLAILLAMDLQAGRHGVEFECHICGHEFLHKVVPTEAGGMIDADHGARCLLNG
jgi:hypothetical protein